ncbi:acyl carrier protein [Jannaschia donghaensis]|uniref:D-alanine--poly(Phosphoribitol) ligase subunit 2 n=1 Tax=Jannaschia donghaensis TaxID=420998 RepID=A0A0M6YL65_9RHOB|nr:acyl carrier protein [Jannaschia donghaensis]CTQ50569.1 D-alanine--poly(phosphoribitol) ligase subunit 2 [Jannaschia donghaensis]
MTADIRTRIHEIVAEQAMIDVADVTDASVPADLGVDSMGLVEAIFAIEEAFDIHVPFNANAPDARNFDYSTVGSIVAAVERLVAEQRG